MTVPASGAVTVSDVVTTLERAYPPELAEEWDAVGLVCGDPAEPVASALVCVDPTEATVAEAIERGVGILIVHHPLLLRGVHGIPANAPKGRLVHRLVRNNIALFCAHTNADQATPGVSDALAATLGVTVTGPLSPRGDGASGLGRIARLDQPERFDVFLQRAADALPVTEPGVRGAGEPNRRISTVGLCGGAGGALLDTATAAGVDAYLTADLRHHPASEHLERGAAAPALVDVTHWASEWPWCTQAAGIIHAELGGTVEVSVSDRRTDPWSLRAAGAASDHGRAPQ